ncbi:hypothetical protein J6590_055124 [Homalodisca vitripennis]|nr:hypothetical protein J6590_055124 [Homalodisca vitripennis]
MSWSVKGRWNLSLYHNHITIHGIKFSWTDGKLIFGYLNGAKTLSELTGYDFIEFLTMLEDEDDGGRPRSQRTPSLGTNMTKDLTRVLPMTSEKYRSTRHPHHHHHDHQPYQDGSSHRLQVFRIHYELVSDGDLFYNLAYTVPYNVDFLFSQ